jgi:deazaflavin-dependent oxidoreductase (nitroreductase family)
MTTEDLADLYWPAKSKKVFDVFRYDTDKSRCKYSLAKIAHDLDAPMVRYTGWSLMAYLFQPRGQGRLEAPILLTTIGSKTGALREKVVSAFEDGPQRWIIIGSNGGLATDPAWVLNLRHDPNAWVVYGRHKYNVRAEELSGGEREAMVAEISRRHPVLPSYIERAAKYGRQIPLLRLQAR